jgi:translation initiation factor 4E
MSAPLSTPSVTSFRTAASAAKTSPLDHGPFTTTSPALTPATAIKEGGKENGGTSLLSDGSWTFWYMARTHKHHHQQQQSSSSSSSSSPYENYVNPIGTVRHDDPRAVEHCVRLYGHLQRASMLPGGTDLHVFRHGIKPVWEDAANSQGGRWTLRLPKGGLADRLWEHLVLALIGGQFRDFAGTVCGAALGVRYMEDVMSVWTRRADDVDGNVRIKERLLAVLQLPASTVMEYKPHQTTLPSKP